MRDPARLIYVDVLRALAILSVMFCHMPPELAGTLGPLQVQGGRDITFVDFNVGFYDSGMSTCQGAGGAFFYSNAGGYVPRNINVVRGNMIACNHSLFVNDAGHSGTVTDAMFRSGRTDGTDPMCTGYAGSPACTGTNSVIPASVTLTNVSCQRWSFQYDRWQ